MEETIRTHHFSISTSPILSTCTIGKDGLHAHWSEDGKYHEIDILVDENIDEYGAELDECDRDTPILRVDADGCVACSGHDFLGRTGEYYIRFWPLSYNPFTNLP